MANGIIKFRDNNEIRSSGTNGFFAYVNGVLSPLGSSSSSSGHSHTGFDLLSFTGGGSGNYVSGDFSVVVGGLYNTGLNRVNFIGGGESNFIGQQSGLYGSSDTGRTANASTVVGGAYNGIFNGDYAFVGGGFLNQVAVTGLSTNFNTIVGGWGNGIIGKTQLSFIGGGKDNTIYNSRSASHLGGDDNIIYSGDYSSTAGGRLNIIYSGASYSTIIGGRNNEISGSGIYGIAGGRKAIVTHSGAAVLADGQDRNHNSKGDNTLSLDYSGGVYVDGSGVFNSIYRTGANTNNSNELVTFSQAATGFGRIFFATGNVQITGISYNQDSVVLTLDVTETGFYEVDCLLRIVLNNTGNMVFNPRLTVSGATVDYEMFSAPHQGTVQGFSFGSPNINASNYTTINTGNPSYLNGAVVIKAFGLWTNTGRSVLYCPSTSLTSSPTTCRGYLKISRLPS